MARKRYILLQDSPEYKAGAIFEELYDDSTQDFTCINGKEFGQVDYVKKATKGRVTYDRTVVMQQPAWFEEIIPVYIPSRWAEKFNTFMKSLGEK